MRKLNREGKKKAYKFANNGKTTKRNRLLHFMRRFQERHGYILSAADVDEILKQINDKSADLIGQGCKGFVYKVKCRDLQIAVVVAPCKKELITTFKLEKKHYEMIQKQKEIAEQRKIEKLRKHIYPKINKENKLINLIRNLKKLFTDQTGYLSKLVLKHFF